MRKEISKGLDSWGENMDTFSDVIYQEGFRDGFQRSKVMLTVQALKSGMAKNIKQCKEVFGLTDEQAERVREILKEGNPNKNTRIKNTANINNNANINNTVNLGKKCSSQNGYQDVLRVAAENLRVGNMPNFGKLIAAQKGNKELSKAEISMLELMIQDSINNRNY